MGSSEPSGCAAMWDAVQVQAGHVHTYNSLLSSWWVQPSGIHQGAYLCCCR